jgi:hypothetical protein
MERKEGAEKSIKQRITEVILPITFSNVDLVKLYSFRMTHEA